MNGNNTNKDWSKIQQGIPYLCGENGAIGPIFNENGRPKGTAT
jgi:hypothetical protein